MNITELAIYKKMFGGGGGGSSAPVEGTAIPVGVPVEKIYFNTNLSVEETNAYLSQLTYVQTPLYPYPVCVIYGNTADGNTGTLVLVAEVDRGVSYTISAVTNISDGTSSLFYDNEWEHVSFYALFALVNGFICDNTGVSLTDFNGLPIGAENEKIKNVISITPFVGTIASNKPTAYTVSSVDELPSNAVDGSLAIVENSDSLIGRWEWKDNQSPLDLSMLNLPSGNFHENVYIIGYDETFGETFSAFRFYRGSGDVVIELGTTALYIGDNFDDTFSSFSLYADIRTIEGEYFTAEDFKTFIKTNCNRLSGGYSLYQRENGEWVYKTEIV